MGYLYLCDMKAATDIVSLYQVLTPAKFLTLEEQEFYVDVYGSQIKRMRTILQLIEDEKHTIYVSGLSGSGKTTALNFLPDTDLHEKFEVKFLMGSDLFDLNDLDIIDVLLILCLNLVEGNKELEKVYLDYLNKVKEQIRGRYEEFTEREKTKSSTIGGGVEAKLGKNPLTHMLTSMGGGLSFLANYRFKRENRKIVREIFRPHVEELLKTTNEIITLYLGKVDKTGDKQLLLIFNELNHIKNLKVIEKLFIDNRIVLERINAKKIITIPITLTFMNGFNAEIEFLGLKINENPLDGQGIELSKEAKDNREILRDIVRKRIDGEVANLVDKEAIDEAIELSGGHIRQFISLLNQAALHNIVNSDGKGKVSYNDLKDGGAPIERQKLSRKLIEEKKIILLGQILEKNIATSQENKTFLECSLSNQVFVYKNSNFWYDVNPLIKGTVKLYAKQIKERGKNDSENA